MLKIIAASLLFVACICLRSAPTSPSHIGMSGLVTPDSLSREGSPTPSDHYHDTSHYQHDSSSTLHHFSDSSNSSHYHDGGSGTATLQFHEEVEGGGDHNHHHHHHHQQYEIVTTPQSPVRHITTQGTASLSSLLFVLVRLTLGSRHF